MKKYLLMILFTITMITVFLICVYCVYNDPVDSTVEFLVNDTETIKLWADDDAGIAYVFLPSFAVLHDTRILVPDGMGVSINGTPIFSGTDCSAFELNKEYPLDIEGSPLKTLFFLQSANVATMYVDTISGNMNKVHRDKSYKEYVDIALYTPDGELNYRGGHTDKIRGHGNITTWDLDKKSYNVYLRDAESLLSMGKGEKYVLLANRTDNSNLRNKIILDFAKRIEAYDGFSPDCEFVDLYLNKEYSGLYLLCSSPKDAVTKIGNSDIQFFWDTELTKRTSRSINNFEINTGISVEVKKPDKIDKYDRNYLKNYLADMQDAMENQDGMNLETGKRWNDYIDLDSWARKYLIEEIFMNYHAVAVSQYYYLKNSDHKIYAGPCWDYDNSLGLLLHTDPNCFLAQRLWKNEETYTPWYHYLWKQQEFRDYVITLYNNEFLPELRNLSKTVLPEEIDNIWTAFQNNALRWNIGQMENAVRAVSAFLDSRIEFLNSAWVDGVEYKTITLTGIEEYRFISTPADAVCKNLPSPRDLGVDNAKGWKYKDSGELFDGNTVISEDITLYVENEETDTYEERTATSYKITILSVAVFAGVLALAFIGDLHNRKR